jgi:hypothetical protein
MTETSYRYPGKEPVYQRAAWLSLTKPATVTSQVQPSGKGPASLSHTVTISPNPFPEELTYRYYVKTDTEATIELFDMTGKLIAVPLKKSLIRSGVYTGTLDAVDLRLTPGMYYLRFTFGNEIIVKKAVKI